MFAEKHCTRLDAENADLRAEIDKLKVKLGYTNLYLPQKSVPVVADTAAQKSNGASSKESAVASQQATKKDVAGGGEKGAKTGAKKGGGSGSAATPEDTQIDVGRLDLRVGRILEAKKHPDADALYVETIDLNEEKPRTVVSGLVRFVPLEEMQNRLVVCVCNLKPAKMRGVESQAMVLCASTAERVEILGVPADAKPGDRVTCAPYSTRPDLPFLNPKKKIWEQVAPDLAVNDAGECCFKGERLLVAGQPLQASTLRNVPVK